MKCKECGQDVKEKSLEEKLEEYYKDEYNVSIQNQFGELAQIAREHYLGVFDEAVEKARKTHGMLDNIIAIEVRKALETE